ncbi:MAG: hypothetical protein ACFFC7_07855 [Candidatus Hermodarchaeota archaeon]
MDKKKKSKKEKLHEEELFPDYTPKTTLDTIYDFLGGPHKSSNPKLVELLKQIPETNLENLKQLLNLFNKYKKKAESDQGVYTTGSVWLGAPEREYHPSDAELMVSELGMAIKLIIDVNSKENIENCKLKEGIDSQEIVFTPVEFWHADVMGSGRFFYAEKGEEIRVRI